jgi:NADH:ubiquinone reductase (H+-translocating)
MANIPRILIVGGGYVGMYTALRLRRKLRSGEATVTVVDPSPTMTYQPFLAEAAAGSIEPRHVVVPLRKVLRGCEVVTGRVTAVDTDRRVATVGDTVRIPYDVLVLAPGSVSRTLPIPGLAEHAVGFGTVAEAVHLRNHLLSRLDEASSVDDPARRRAALTVTVVGAGYSGVEVLAELEDMARYALRHHPRLAPADLRWVLVEASDRILPEVSLPLARYTADRLRERGIDVRLGTRLVSVVDGHVRLSDGDGYDADTVIWTAGVRANPLAARLGLPVDARGRLVCDAELRLRDVPGVWAAGDAAAVPDLSVPEPGALCGPSAQHAVRQARRLAGNIVGALRGRPVKPYRHAYAGSVAGLGRHKGVAEVYGVKLRGWLAWMLHRVYHLSRVPTLDRKVRVLADWTLTALLRREVVGLEQVEHPRRAWDHATGEQLSAGVRDAA